MISNRELETDRRIQNRTAPKYDRQIGFFERVLFAGGREWVCSQPEGDVLELAVGMARNLAHYPVQARVSASRRSRKARSAALPASSRARA